VEAARGQSDDGVPRPAGAAVDDLGLVDEADAESGQVPFPGAIEAGKLRGLAADQSAAGLAAASGDAPDGTCR